MAETDGFDEPGGRRPAPGSLRLVQLFLNSHDILPGIDTITTPEELKAWLRRRDLVSSSVRVRSDDLRRALAVREALRGLAVRNGGEVPDGDPVAALNRVARRASLRVAFSPDGHATLEPSRRDVDGALAVILAGVALSMVEGTWHRLKACRNCRWAFYDHSKNRSGAWCTMSVCGNRSKALAFRSRHRAEAVR